MNDFPTAASPDVKAWHIARDMCVDYSTALIRGWDMEDGFVERYLRKVMQDAYGTPPPEVFEALLGTFFLSDRTSFPSNLPTDRLLLIALSNPACPSNLLAAAACNNRFEYRDKARNNPSCPDEYEVYFALWKASHDFTC